jgi:crotonobetainyl-CoA:carnitine CoA-transferase CaiB-like acyl-CoA transferase
MAAFRPLVQVKVLEWAGALAGPFCGKLLGAFGADVIKIEQPGKGDESRAWGPFPGDEPHPERSGLFLYLNTDKRSITLDPTISDGNALLKRLLDWADVFVVDKQPELLNQLDLDAQKLQTFFPHLLVTSITPFGLSGPYRDYRTYPVHTGHIGGSAYLQPSGHLYASAPELPPVSWGGYSSDYDVGLQAAIATLAALFPKSKLSTGQHIDVSKQEAGVHAVRHQVDSWATDGTIQRRIAAAPPRPAGISGTMRCKDGYVTLWPLEPAMPPALMRWLGHPEWEGEAPATLREKVESALLGYTMQELYQGLQAVGVAVSPIYRPPDILNSPQLQDRQFFQRVVHPEAGELPYPGLPFGDSLDGRADVRPAPLLGQHNREVYCDTLGLTLAELVRLRHIGAV